MRAVVEVFLVILIALATPLVVHAQSSGNLNDMAANITNTINNFMNSITNGAEDVINNALANLISFTNFLKSIIYNASEVLAILFGVLGGFLWLSGISPYRGRRLVVSAVLLALLAIVIAHI